MARSKKTYVCGDIHGMYGSYMQVIRKLKTGDELFVIGDVIDRGKNGIKILKDVMKRKNTHFLLGNHELMMIQSLDIINEYGLKLSDIKKVCQIGELKKAIFQLSQDMKLVKTDKEKENYNRQIQKYIEKARDLKSPKNIAILFDDEIGFLHNWLVANKGMSTLEDYMKMPSKEQKDMYKFLTNSAIFISDKINGQYYAFVHSRPAGMPKDWIKQFKSEPTELTYNDTLENVGEGLIHYMLWMRDSKDKTDPYLSLKKEGFITICGHEPMYEIEDERATRGFLRLKEENLLCFVLKMIRLHI